MIPILRKDSLHITDDDRELIRRTIAQQPHRHVLVTHGTDTMVETARVLQPIPDKVIVLTGALNPARFQNSDAVFNIGCAVGAPGAARRRLHRDEWPSLGSAQRAKNRAANRFEAS